MLENEVIVDKLKEEGISETLGNGLQFEDETGLNAWVDAYKSGLPTPTKGLNDYTREELEEIAKDPQFKGAKGLQGLLDKVRQAKPTEPPKGKEGDNEAVSKLTEELQALRDEIKQGKEESEKKSQESKAISEIKKTFTEQEDIDLVLLKLGGDFSKVSEAVESHTKYLQRFKPNYIPGKSSGKTDKFSNTKAKESYEKKYGKKKK